MLTKVFVHFTHLKLPQISQTYLKFIVWSGHLIKIHKEYDGKYFLGISSFYQKWYILHALHEIYPILFWIKDVQDNVKKKFVICT
jgi:hypothetical protein